MALMQSLAPPQQPYLPLLTVVHSSNAPSSALSTLECPMAASTSKGKGKATALSPPMLAQESSTSLSTAWKMVEQHFSAKEKGKSKAKETDPSTVTDGQLAHLL
ncbi:hypothetical protein C0989_011294, partial [Termitomyces sp. Mn162]